MNGIFSWRPGFSRAVRRTISLLFVAAVLSNVAQAADKAKKHFLWKVESDKGTVYLLGSVHAAKKELYPLDKVIRTAFDDSDKVVFEVPLDEKTQRDAGVKLLKAARYPAGESLRKSLDPKTRKLFDDYAKKAKLPAALLDGYRPWFVAITVTMLELQKHGYSPAHGVDQHFQKKAAENKKPILGLETVDDQVGLFTNLKAGAQAKMLKQTLEESAKIGKMLDGLFESWKTGDTKSLDKLMLEPMRDKEYRQLYKTMFVDRNVKMAGKIEGFLKTDSTYFVVVGAGHLVSKEGIIAMLKAKKYKITQL